MRFDENASPDTRVHPGGHPGEVQQQVLRLSGTVHRFSSSGRRSVRQRGRQHRAALPELPQPSALDQRNATNLTRERVRALRDRWYD